MFSNVMLKEKGIPPLLYSAFTNRKAEALQCSSLELFCGKQVTSSVQLKKSVAIGEKLPQRKVVTDSPG